MRRPLNRCGRGLRYQTPEGVGQRDIGPLVKDSSMEEQAAQKSGESELSKLSRVSSLQNPGSPALDVLSYAASEEADCNTR